MHSIQGDNEKLMLQMQSKSPKPLAKYAIYVMKKQMTTTTHAMMRLH